jgi:hypothetical protein
VADAKRSNATVHPKAHALTLSMAFPGAQYSLERIVQEMVKVAIKADVPVELGPET